jgi:putative CocE/NonD family hydrolase
MTQWLVAGLKPPSLKAMIPWEGAADMYRDFGYHGGIFSFTFVVNWYNNHMAHHLLGKPQATSPDAFATPWVWEYMRYNLDSEWYHGRRALWENIDCPLYSAGNWSGMGLHLRGNSEAYMRAASKHKKLRIHAGTHYHPFYSAEGRLDQLRFFDHWLKGLDTGIMREPPVKLLIRKGGQGNSEWRFENEWPIKRTRWTKFFLRPAARGSDEAVPGALVTDAPRKASSLSYSASGMTKAGVASASWTSTALAGSLPPMGASFATDPLAEETEVTGPIVLVLWVASSTEDMDIFATIRNIAPDGSDVFELGQQSQPVPVAKGWLRASHRKLDPHLSLPYRPYHAHTEREILEPGTPVRVDVEIWPTSMVFKKGHRIRLDIQPRDGIGSAPYTHYAADYNSGTNTIFTGGARASYLLLPVIPRRT